MTKLILIWIIGIILLAGSVMGAWWSNDYAYKMPINCSNIISGTPIVINGSQGIGINGDKQIIWTKCMPNLYIYYNNASSYAISNESDSFNYEVEKGNSSSYNKTGVWAGTNVVSVYHLTNVNDSYGTNHLVANGAASLSTGYGCLIGGCANFSAGLVGFYNASSVIGFPRGTANLTMMCLFNTTNMLTGPGYQFGNQFGLYNTVATNPRHRCGSYSNYAGGPDWWIWGGGADWHSGHTYSANTLELITVTITSTYKSMYKNTAKATTSATNYASNPLEFYLNLCESTGYVSYAYFDECRVYNNTLSDKNVNDTYYNYVAISGYGTLGEIETQTAEFPSISLSSTTPINVTYTFNTTPIFSGNISNIIGTWNISLYDNATVVGTKINVISTGTFNITSSALTANQEHLWYFKAVDSTNASNVMNTETRNIYVAGNTNVTSTNIRTCQFAAGSISLGSIISCE